MWLWCNSVQRLHFIRHQNLLCPDLLQDINGVRSDLPNYEDLKGAAAALMRLQDTYQLDTATVAEGDLYGVKSPPLSGESTTLFYTEIHLIIEFFKIISQQGCQIMPQIGPDWHQMVIIWDFLRLVFCSFWLAELKWPRYVEKQMSP